MDRRTILVWATCIAVLAATLPLLAIASYSRHRAVESEKQHLTDYSGWILQRARQNFDLVGEVFDTLERENRTVCSTEHVARMRQLTINSESVDEIGFFEKDRLRCTSWGPVRQVVGKGTPDTVLSNGDGLYLDLRPVVTQADPLLAISRGSYNVLMRPERLVDVLTDTQMTLGIATLSGRLIAINGHADKELVARISREAGFGLTDDSIFATAQDANFRAFAISHRSTIADRVDEELVLLIPLGLSMSVVLVGLVVWVSRQRLSPQKELEFAIRRKEFVACYQPMIELSTGLCVGAEALVRWKRPDGTWVAPDLFIPLAEQSGLIEPLTDLMIERVASDLADMLQRERSIHIAINICPADMQSGRFLPVLAKALSGTNIKPSQIWLEATERGFMDAAAARVTIEKARQMGHLVAIDDFGTGYSTLALLETLPLDALKIDKSFVDAIGTEAATSIVTPHIIEMAHGLKLSIVAEGVETEAQERYLKNAGVEFAQGWLYAKALPVDEFLAFYERSNAGEISRFVQAL